MDKDTKKEIPGQLLMFDITLPDRASSTDKPGRKEETVNDLRGIFGDYTCESLKFSSTHKNADPYGFYCEITDSQCVYPDCTLFTPIKQ